MLSRSSLPKALLGLPPHLARKADRRCPDRQRIAPIEIVIPHGHEERGRKLEDRPDGRAHPWSPTLAHRGNGGGDIPSQMTHPDPVAIALHPLDAIPFGPLIEQIW